MSDSESEDFCSTCLDTDRDLQPVNSHSILTTLREWFKQTIYRVNVHHFKICWECAAMILRVYEFKQKVFEAQQIRISALKQKTRITKPRKNIKKKLDSQYKEGSNDQTAIKPKEISLKRKQEDSRSKSKSKRQKGHDPDSEKVSKLADQVIIKSVAKMVNSKLVHNKSFTKIVKQVTKQVKGSTKDIKGKVIGFIDLTKDPKLSAMPIVLLEKEIKQELIDIELQNTQAKATKEKIIEDAGKNIPDQAEAENETATVVIQEENRGDRPSVIMHSKEAEIDYADPNRLKFTVVNLSEEEMLEARESDRSERVYVKYFLKCKSCVIGFADEAALDKHNEEKHGEHNGDFVCPICAYRFKTESLLKEHEETHYFSYKCCQCDYQHHKRYVIEMHVVKEHDLKPSHVCAACDTEFASQHLLNEHVEKAHKEKLKCNHCAQSFVTVERLMDHVSSHKDGDEVVETFRCDLCKSSFAKAAYRAHMQLVHNELALQAYCEQCDVQFSSLDEFTLHIREHSAFDQLKFGLPTDSDSKRVNRMLTHSCGLCKKGFSDQSRLKVHIQQKHPEVVITEEPSEEPAREKSKGRDPSPPTNHAATNAGQKPSKSVANDKSHTGGKSHCSTLPLSATNDDVSDAGEKPSKRVAKDKSCAADEISRRSASTSSSTNHAVTNAREKPSKRVSNEKSRTGGKSHRSTSPLTATVEDVSHTGKKPSEEPAKEKPKGKAPSSSTNHAATNAGEKPSKSVANDKSRTGGKSHRSAAPSSPTVEDDSDGEQKPSKRLSNDKSRTGGKSHRSTSPLSATVEDVSDTGKKPSEEPAKEKSKGRAPSSSTNHAATNAGEKPSKRVAKDKLRTGGKSYRSTSPISVTDEDVSDTGNKPSKRVANHKPRTGGKSHRSAAPSSPTVEVDSDGEQKPSKRMAKDKLRNGGKSYRSTSPILVTDEDVSDTGEEPSKMGAKYKSHTSGKSSRSTGPSSSTEQLLSSSGAKTSKGVAKNKSCAGGKSHRSASPSSATDQTNRPKKVK